MEKRSSPSCIHQKIKEQFKYLPPLESELFEGGNQVIPTCGTASRPRTVTNTLWEVLKCRINWTENTDLPLGHSLGQESHKIWKSKCSLKGVWMVWMRKLDLEHQSLEAAKSDWGAWEGSPQSNFKAFLHKGNGNQRSCGQMPDNGFNTEHPSRSETGNKRSLNINWLKTRTKAWEGRVV